jgi:hypothetical protein
VRDEVSARQGDDPILTLLIDLASVEITEQRALFPNPLDEPVFYRRYFKRWVSEGLNEAVAMTQATDDVKAASLGR